MGIAPLKFAPDITPATLDIAAGNKIWIDAPTAQLQTC
jgi:hypothetical protein